MLYLNEYRMNVCLYVTCYMHSFYTVIKNRIETLVFLNGSQRTSKQKWGDDGTFEGLEGQHILILGKSIVREGAQFLKVMGINVWVNELFNACPI